MWASSCSLLFHEVTSLHPLSFLSNDFSTLNNYDDNDVDIKIRISCMGRSSRGEMWVYTLGLQPCHLGVKKNHLLRVCETSQVPSRVIVVV